MGKTRKRHNTDLMDNNCLFVKAGIAYLGWRPEFQRYYSINEDDVNIREKPNKDLDEIYDEIYMGELPYYR